MTAGSLLFSMAHPEGKSISKLDAESLKTSAERVIGKQQASSIVRRAFVIIKSQYYNNFTLCAKSPSGHPVRPAGAPFFLNGGRVDN
ncbi:MAG TPA: hypothetical protein DDW67_06355 [Elusimicrobia bacterium]|nr:hypothetical protein [Elusimicrobiota bacterium]